MAIALALLPPSTPPVQTERLTLKLHRKQGVAFQSRATEILYGGAAGGGKSHLFRVAAIAWCMAIPGLQVYIFRRQYPDLFKNHMEGPKGFPVLLAALLIRKIAWIDWGKLQIRFKNGSVIHLCHCQHEKHIYNYLGAEIHVLIIDELTQWTRKMYAFLRSRVRMVGIKLPPAFAGCFPRILNGSNPGNIGHNWVKQDFVTRARPLALSLMPDEDGGMVRQFIPARMSDNPSLMHDDPDYAKKLRGLGDPSLVRAMESGDWNIVAGGMFDDLWDEAVHVVQPFRIPSSWRVDRSFDWGSSKPYSVGWWAESDGTDVMVPDSKTGAPVRRHFPRGTLFRIYELYGWNGTPDEGTKRLAVDIARDIYQRDQEFKKEQVIVVPGPADTSIFDVENGMAIADDMKKARDSAGKPAGVTWTEADKSPGSRKTGWEAIRKRLQAAKETRAEDAGLYVFSNCVQFIRTVPVLPRDPKKMDDVDTKAEDHIGDESRYRVLAPRTAWTQTRVVF